MKPLLSHLESGGGRSFDELAQGVAAGNVSRRRAIKLAGGALLGGALIPFFAPPAEARRRRRNACRRKADACTSNPPNCRGNPNCFCIRTAEGGKVCANLANEECPSRDECDRNSDCGGRNQYCAVVENCCGNPRNLCVRKCA